MPSIEPIPLQGASSLLWNYYKPACNSWSFIGRMLSVVADAAQSFGALQHPLRTSSSSSIIPISLSTSIGLFRIQLGAFIVLWMPDVHGWEIQGQILCPKILHCVCGDSLDSYRFSIRWFDRNDVAYEHFSREVTEFGPSRAKSLPANLGPVQAHRRVI